MKRSLIVIPLFVAVLLISVGYAAVSSSMNVFGSASSTPPPKGIFITDVEVVEANGVTSVEVVDVFPTNLISTVNASRSGSITYKITVENNTDATYWYRGILQPDDYEGYQNNLIGSSGGISIVTKDKLADSSASFNTNDWVPPHTVRSFYVTYNFGANALGTSSTIINFSFGGRIASYGDDFLAILNDPDRYPILAEAFNNTYRDNNSTVIGNVGTDATFLNNLFGTELMLDGKPVTIMIERKDVDGKSATGDNYYPTGPRACEYTIYVTTENPQTGTPTVYAVSYTKEPDGQWIQIGELYEGTTTVGTYTASNGEQFNTINVDSWVATKKTYTVFTYKNQSVTYKVNERYGNSFQQQKTIEELMSMKDQELYNQLNNHQLLKDVYQVLFVTHVGSTDTEILLLREAYDNALRFYEMRNNGQEFRLDNNATRAELLSVVENLFKAMEYYNQVHDTNHN